MILPEPSTRALAPCNKRSDATDRTASTAPIGAAAAAAAAVVAAGRVAFFNVATAPYSIVAVIVQYMY